MYKEDLPLNNQCLICHPTKPNQTKPLNLLPNALYCFSATILYMRILRLAMYGLHSSFSNLNFFFFFFFFFFFQKRYYHHHVVPLAQISLTLSRHFSLSFITSGRSSGLHLVSSHSCWMYVRAGRPAFAWPYVEVHRSTSLCSSLLLQQYPACLVLDSFCDGRQLAV